MADKDITRPYPPPHFMNEFSVYTRLIPANEIYDWVDRQVISESGNLYNPDHFHLHTADIACWWMAKSADGTTDARMVRSGADIHYHAGR